MTDAEKREKVIRALECCVIHVNCAADGGCPYRSHTDANCLDTAIKEALALLKAQEQRHRLEVHNIGNVDVPEGVTWEQFQTVMSGVVKALEHTDRGESWPYDEDRR